MQVFAFTPFAKERVTPFFSRLHNIDANAPKPVSMILNDFPWRKKERRIWRGHGRHGAAKLGQRPTRLLWWFLTEGIAELFREINPVTDFIGRDLG